MNKQIDDKMLNERQKALLKAALEYAGNGWAVFPVHGIEPAGSCDCKRTDCTSPGKHPCVAGGFKSAAQDQQQIEQWWQKDSTSNIGIRTGEESGIVVLDIDERSGGCDSLLKLQEKYDELPPSVMVVTGGGGAHIYFKHPGFKVKSRSQAFGSEYPGLDIKGDGGYVVAPPSNHASGKCYKWNHQGDLPDIPDWLLPLIKEEGRPASISVEVTRVPEITGIPEGTRHDSLIEFAIFYHRQGFDQATTINRLLHDNVMLCSPPLSENEVIDMGRWAINCSRSYPYRLTDSGNAKHFVSHYKVNFRNFINVLSSGS